ncbi:D-alanine--D-alanine ligase family protein [Antrihabitans cavernicola]|uniref:D-alanine--D-alanine ligase n=1 Tax=Antrihabitans cavernicola TaxID=2495913 RepID=A0A5A7SDH7_9NOCA|nr:D-alanine--D-alanine ligase [Spelaeibacter cavernicola]KAA0022271.1 D-alanine--D-alanine ligase [Spelaeibacter cavernicola]
MTVHVLHLAGSASSEFLCDLSRLYAADCVKAAADEDRYKFSIAYVTPDGLWRFPTDLGRDAIDAADPYEPADAVRQLVNSRIDVVVPQMFCVPGMTTYRALFDLLAIPYVGNTPAVMALGANKALARAVVGAAGVDVPTGQVVTRGERVSIPAPAVVKPVDGDNSVGLAFVGDADAYDAALAAAFEYCDDVLVESYVELGREVRCGIVVRDGELLCLPLEEYRVTKRVRDHEDKISRDRNGDLSLVAKVRDRAWIVDPRDPVTKRVWEAARKCHAALGCRDYSLFDFRIDPTGNPWFLEAGLYCSFAENSVIAMMASAAGIPLNALFGTAIDAALRGRSPLR